MMDSKRNGAGNAAWQLLWQVSNLVSDRLLSFIAILLPAPRACKQHDR